MTPDELAAVEARAAAATPGPWVMEVRDEAFVFLMGSALQRRANHQVQHSFEYEHGLDPEEQREQYAEAEANARLIAAARADVPELVAEVRRLQEPCNCKTIIACGRSSVSDDVEAYYAAERDGQETPGLYTGCGVVSSVLLLFRCLQCGRWMHADCLRSHFRTSAHDQPRAELARTALAGEGPTDG